MTETDMRFMLEVLASDTLEGRETGEAGQKKAAAFIANHFQTLGLKPVSHGGYFQHTSMSARSNGNYNFVVNAKNFVYMRDYFYPGGWKDTLVVLDSIAFAGLGISNKDLDDFSKLNVQHMPVIFSDQTPKSRPEKIAYRNSMEERIHNAEANGATMAIIVTDKLDDIIDQSVYKNSPFVKASIPYVFVSEEMAVSFFPEYNEKKYSKALSREVSKGKASGFISSSSAELSFISNTSALQGENVIGYLEGTDKKDEVLVLTAHYDHLGIRDSLLYPGADDNASGTTAVMEMAKIFSLAAREGHRPRRSILFMTVSGEEKGLLGSKYYVKHPVVPLNQTIANLNTDMIGRIDLKHDTLESKNYVYIIGSDKLSTTLHKINEAANASFTKLDFDYTFNHPDDPNRFYYRSDHYNFAKNNIPVIFYFNGSHDDYHRPTDTPDKIQYDLLIKRTQLIFLTAWELANREERITVDVVSDMPNKKED